MFGLIVLFLLFASVMYLVPAVIEWSLPVSKRKSVPVQYTREARVREAVRAAEREKAAWEWADRWARLSKYATWLEAGNPICKVHERSYERMLHTAQVQDLARDIMRDDVDALDVRRQMLALKEVDRKAWERVSDIVLHFS